MNKFVFNGIDVEHICKPKIKNSYISITKDAKVILKTPKVSKTFINALLESKEDWIKKQLVKINSNPPIKVNLEYEVLLFGEIYLINNSEVQELKESLERVRIKTFTNISKCYDNFYKKKSETYLTNRLEYFSKKMLQSYNKVIYKKLKSRWGSCSSKRVITLNTQLLKLEKELIDYVVVHELAHLVYMNHSKEFHNLVEFYLPNSKLLRKKIKESYLK